MQTERGTRGVWDRIHFVDGEVCAVLAADNTLLKIEGGRVMDKEQTDAALRKLYDDALRWLNEGIGNSLQTWQPAMPGRPDPLEQDLGPGGLLRGLAQGKQTQLTPLRRSGDVFRRNQALRPYVLLPRDAARSTVLAFYTIDGPPIGYGAGRPASDWRVPEMVNLVNRRLLRDTELQRTDDGWSLLAATPNWITAGGGDETCPGPGSKPQPAEIGDWRFEFPNPVPVDGETLAEIVAGAASDGPSDIVVVVLDTSPSADWVRRREKAVNPDPNNPVNPLLRTVVDPATEVKIDGDLSTDEQYFQFLAGIAANWHTGVPSARPVHHFRMPDHGLFSAGIIRNLAPQAEVHLLRVLNEYGVGDVLVLAQILSDLPEALLTANRRRLVINMSLMCDVPVSERLLDFWFPNCSQDPKSLCDYWADICATFSAIQTSIEAAVSWTQEQADRVLVVAAAGNDNLDAVAGGFARPEPRYPARYDDVFGVAAVKADGTASDYSNRGDIAIMGNGVAVYGGNAAPSKNDDPPDIPPSPAAAASGRARPSRDGVVGIYTADGFPLSVPDGQRPPPNDSGWVYWSGTSFATPIISGIAADYWATHRDAQPWQIRSAIRRLQTDLDGQLDVPAITAVQYRV